MTKNKLVPSKLFCKNNHAEQNICFLSVSYIDRMYDYPFKKKFTYVYLLVSLNNV